MPDKNHKKLRVIDFFCGAGGFSEGFRQQGFEIVMGVDNWAPAVKTHNINHGLKDKPMDVLDFEDDGKIEELPDTEIIIGSPPCVSFSMSNKAGKADKSLGIRLIEAYLRVIAVKKHKKGSILKAWLLENVPNSRNYVKESYTFRDLNLTAWAKRNGKNPESVALKAKDNGDILVAADYGSPQKRERFVCGEIVTTGTFPAPRKTHSPEGKEGLKKYVSLKEIIGEMPKPDTNAEKSWKDPNYPFLKLKTKQITDQFYDTGVYENEWRTAKHAKDNHPFMGRMAFPEDPNRPSRTIMATRSASTREALLYKSEYDRKGDGEYRLPTIREASSLMGFPYTYQFTGSEGTKWKQIGNAVCPHMSSSLAKEIRKAVGMKPIPVDELNFPIGLEKSKEITNLNDFKRKEFNNPPKKKQGAVFRRHPYKQGNMTVALTNFDPSEKKDAGNSWHATVFIGAGKEYDVAILKKDQVQEIGKMLQKTYNGEWKVFKERFRDLQSKVGCTRELQRMYEENRDLEGLVNPVKIVDSLVEIIDSTVREDKPFDFRQNGWKQIIKKAVIPKKQMFAMYAIGKISETTKR